MEKYGIEGTPQLIFTNSPPPVEIFLNFVDKLNVWSILLQHTFSIAFFIKNLWKKLVYIREKILG